jgi:glutamate N-acetyltransferase/amino-acid N-acetyltransferase
MSVNLPPLGELAPIDGVRLGTACAGIKQNERDDVTVILLDAGTTVSGVFTKSSFRAPPVRVCEQVIAAGGVRALVINSGNANAATGDAGRADALTICDSVSQATNEGFEGSQVLPFSTGVIGERLPVDRMTPAVAEATARAVPDGWSRAAHAIMTTDTGPKALSRTVKVDGGVITLTGMCKGAGMIKPDMATMLAYICTDALIEKPLLDNLVRHAANASFNRITIDGDTSTNDSFVVCATGCSGLRIDDFQADAGVAFAQALTDLAIELAQRIVRDGEGATRFVTVRVDGAARNEEALQVAYTVAESPLVKTAMFAGDPNWGRFCMAIGRAGIDDLDVSGVELYLDEVCIARKGEAADDYDEARAAAVMEGEEFTVNINLGRGSCTQTLWTTDLSYEYVRINAEYRT